jgi:Lrp/AsnC family transcriptional regulator for asnA, asnC and gidA
MVMDELDLAVLEQLKTDGRKSFAQIARALGVSLNAARRRYEKMVASGAMRIICVVDPRQMGYSAFASVYVKVEPPCLRSSIEQLMASPQVTWLAEMTGSFNLAIDVCCRDTDHLHEFLTQQLGKIEGVRETQTSIYLRVHKALSLPTHRSLGPEGIRPRRARTERGGADSPKHRHEEARATRRNTNKGGLR